MTEEITETKETQETGDEEKSEETPVVDEGETKLEEKPEETPPKEEVPEKPTIEDVIARLDKQEKRQQYLQRKLGRPGVIPEKTEPPKAKPQEGSFETHGEFIEALTDWKVDERDAARAETRTKLENQQREEDFFAVINAGHEKYADFDEVARKKPEEGGPTINGIMLEAMADCDNPVEIAYWLGQNVVKSRWIAGMGVVAAAREIGKLDASFAGNIPTPQKIKTNAPSPTKPVGNKETSVKSEENMTTDEFIASRNKKEVEGII